MPFQLRADKRNVNGENAFVHLPLRSKCRKVIDLCLSSEIG